MRKLTKTLTLLGLSAALAFPVQAAFEQTGNRSARVSGEGESGSMVTLQVFKGDYSPESLKNLPEGTSYLDILVCHDQTKVGANGTYAFDFSIEGSTGTYTAYTSFEGTGAPVPETLFFIDSEEVRSVLSELHAATVATSAEVQTDSDSSVEDIITDGHKARVLGFEIEEGINTASLSKIFYSYIKNADNNFTHDDRNDAMEAFGQCMFVQKLNQSKITNLFDYPEYSRLEESRVQDWYEDTFVTEKLQKDMTTRLSGKNFASLEAYENEILEAFILATTRYPNGYGNLQKVLKEFYEDAGIEEGKITGTVCKGLSGKNYENYLQLQSAVKKLSSSGEGGGGTGGGGGGSSRPVNVEIQGQTTTPVTPVTPSGKSRFSDISHVAWAQSAIEELAEKGIINGKGDGRFCPDDMVTREEFTKMVVEAFNVQGSSDVAFSDVSGDAWYRTYVERAFAANIIKGLDGETFGTGRNISRQDMAVICLNIAKYKGLATGGASQQTFGDDANISEYAKEAVYTLKEMGIIGGMGDNRYEPQGFATRAQAAVILQRLLAR